jgi:hypothetical protein
MDDATRRSSAIGVLLIVVLVSSCAGTGREPLKSGTPNTTLVTGSSTTVPVTSSTQGESLRFLRRDAPPTGVARQVAFYAGAGGEDPYCQFERPLPSKSSPYLILAADVERQSTQVLPKRETTIMVFDRSEVCLVGFVPNRSVTLRVILPNGVIERHNVIDQESSLSGLYSYESDYNFGRRPIDPIGKYQVVAMQGRRKASLSITLVPRSEPTLIYSLSEGKIEVSGYQRSQDLALNFYGGRNLSSFPQVGNTSDYLLPYLGTMNVRLDVNGQGTYPWPAALKKGCYGVDVKGYRQSKPVQCSE